MITQIPGGQLAQRVGGKVLMLFAIGTCSLLAILTPLFARIGDWKVKSIKFHNQLFIQIIIKS